MGVCKVVRILLLKEGPEFDLKLKKGKVNPPHKGKRKHHSQREVLYFKGGGQFAGAQDPTGLKRIVKKERSNKVEKRNP